METEQEKFYRTQNESLEAQRKSAQQVKSWLLWGFIGFIAFVLIVGTIAGLMAS